MCGRFTITKPEGIKKRFSTSNKMPLFEPSWNIAPSQMIPTITRNSPNIIKLMKWGLVWSKSTRSGTINLRSESFKEKPFFKRFLLEKRCLIVADSFYEWGEVNLEGKQEKYPFNFFLNERELFGLAGVYNDLADAEGKPFYTCAILTCQANDPVKKVHNRMPVIIKKEDEDSWLDKENQNLDALFDKLKSYGGDLKMHIVSRRVNNPRNDDADLIREYKDLKLQF